MMNRKLFILCVLLITISYTSCIRRFIVGYMCPKVRPHMCTLIVVPTCGWYDETIKCVAYPCAINVSNPCAGCSDKHIKYITCGACPKTGSKPIYHKIKFQKKIPSCF